MMRMSTHADGAAALLALAACGGSEPARENHRESGPSAEALQVLHSGIGDVTEIAGHSVTIAHGPIESLEWPAMTMTFMASTPQALNGVEVGDTVAFRFRAGRGGYALVSVERARRLESPTSGRS